MDWRHNPAANADDTGFTGHIRDTATGLTYAQARYYDPAIGRFLSNDPVGFAEGGWQYFNRYSYTFNDPVNNTDPTGMCGTLESEESERQCETIVSTEASSGGGGPDGEGQPVYGHQPIVVPTWQQGTSRASVVSGVGQGSIPLGAATRNGIFGAALALSGSTPRIDTATVATTGSDQVLFHYTNAEGMAGILSSQVINPSLHANNPRDARLGDGIYLSSVVPGTQTSGQLARRFIGIPNQHRFTHYVAIRVNGLTVRNSASRPDVFVVPSAGPLPVGDRIVAAGPN